MNQIRRPPNNPGETYDPAQSPNPGVRMPDRFQPWPSGIPRSPPVRVGSDRGISSATGGFANLAKPDGVFDRWHVAYPLNLSFPLTDSPTQSLKVLTQPDGYRNLLIIRNASPGTEIIYVSFGQEATTSSALALTGVLAANTLGGIALFDVVVPQQDIWVLGSATTAVVVLSYSNIPL